MTASRASLRLAIAILVVAAACTGRETPSATTWSPDSASIVFTATRDGNADLYLRIRGTPPTRLTNHPASDNFARFAPDGRSLAFQSRRSGAIDIYLMAAEGTDVVNLTAHPAYDVLPAWSPDGQRLAFMSTRDYELGSAGPFPGHLYAMNADGTNLTQLTREPLTSSLGPQDWAPDGRSILLSRSMDGSLDLFLLNAATGDETRLTNDPTNEHGAAFSHDGTRIAFHAEADGTSQIVVMQRDGTGRRTVTPRPGLRYGPRWSPDDTWLLYTVQGSSERDYDLEAVRIEDGTVITVLATPEDEREGDWLQDRR